MGQLLPDSMKSRADLHEYPLRLCQLAQHLDLYDVMHATWIAQAPTEFLFIHLTYILSTNVPVEDALNRISLSLRPDASAEAASLALTISISMQAGRCT